MKGQPNHKDHGHELRKSKGMAASSASGTEADDPQSHDFGDNSEPNIEVMPWGPTSDELAVASQSLLENRKVQEYLRGARYRMLSLRLVEKEARGKARRVPLPPDQYEATIYDYTNNRTIIVRGRLEKPDRIQVTESTLQPLPNAEEFQAAVAILDRDANIGPRIRDGSLAPYRPMPPLVQEEFPNSSGERTLAVGLLPQGEVLRHEIVGVNMVQESVTRFESGAPKYALATSQTCGITLAHQPTTGRYTPGTAAFTITDPTNQALWTLTVTRPSNSSGFWGSGIELQDVRYRGKLVLFRAHVPILNVKYDNDTCGPYRDWQWQEGAFQAGGPDVAPGFRRGYLTVPPPQTILESGNDAGNFWGVAYYRQGGGTVLVSELEAGWYRYKSEWHLEDNGTIKARFGFSGVQNSCVCNRHHHHVYWRFHFATQGINFNRVREQNSGAWQTFTQEVMRPRDYAQNRQWLIDNPSTGAGYLLTPGMDDGVATASPDSPFPQGDVWILKHRPTEIDDSQGLGQAKEAQLNKLVNGEGLAGPNGQIAIWYAAHFTHDVAMHPGFGHIVGPDLIPVNW
jgi:hypothetical protein